jgi:hypothetical protein
VAEVAGASDSRVRELEKEFGELRVLAWAKKARERLPYALHACLTMAEMR